VPTLLRATPAAYLRLSFLLLRRNGLIVYKLLASRSLTRAVWFIGEFLSSDSRGIHQAPFCQRKLRHTFFISEGGCRAIVYGATGTGGSPGRTGGAQAEAVMAVTLAPAANSKLPLSNSSSARLS
jgi:hypothetical protein